MTDIPPLDYDKISLDNGFTAFLHKMKNGLFASIGQFHCGFITERKFGKGIVHPLEHLLSIGGSKKYSRDKIFEINDSFGISHAYVNHKETCFETQGVAEDIIFHLNVFSDSIQNPLWDEVAIREEIQTTLIETQRMKSDPVFFDHKKFMDSIYGPAGEHGIIKCTDDDVLSSLDSKQVKDFYHQTFTASNCNLFLVGDYSKDIVSVLKNNFSSWPKGENLAHKFNTYQLLDRQIIQHTYAPDRQNTKDPDKSLAQVYLVFLTPCQNHDSTYDLEILSYVLGGCETSYLFQDLRRKKGDSYDCTCAYDGEDNQGVFEISFECPCSKLEESLQITFDCIDKLKHDLIDNRYIDFYLRKKTFAIKHQMQTCAGTAEIMKIHNETGLSPKQYLLALQNVNPRTLKKTANQYLPSRKDNYALLIRDPLKK